MSASAAAIFEAAMSHEQVDRLALDDYLAPRGVELTRKAGVEPEVRILDVREFA